MIFKNLVRSNYSNCLITKQFLNCTLKGMKLPYEMSYETAVCKVQNYQENIIFVSDIKTLSLIVYNKSIMNLGGDFVCFLFSKYYFEMNGSNCDLTSQNSLIFPEL